MIKTFRYQGFEAGLEAFFKTGSKAGIQASHSKKLRILLTALDNVKCPNDMNAPSWKLHPLIGSYDGHYSVKVSGNWRMTFTFEDEDAVLVNYQDYH